MDSETALPNDLLDGEPVEDFHGIPRRGREMRCWAYGPSGQRCELDAAHAGNHLVSTSWSDDESLTPDMFMTTIYRDGPPSDPARKLDSEACVACGHTHEGACPCGCYNPI